MNTMTNLAPVQARQQPAVREVRSLRVALAGCGTVGLALAVLVRQHREWFERRHGVHFEIARVLVRDAVKPRGEALPRHLVTTNRDEFLRSEADVLVELIGGMGTADGLVRDALARGRSVVTANKTLVATHGVALQQLADRHGASLHFGAAVGGGVPVVRTLRGALGGHGVRTITGILNGTTNYLLTRLAGGASFSEALADAQARGFAESDPSRDLQGLDAADKIRILAWLAWGIDPSKVAVRVEQLPADPAPLARRAAARDGVLKYLAGAVRGDGEEARAWVRPVIVPKDHAFAHVRDEENAVHIDSDSLGVVRLQGRGAGGSATASAVLGDLLCVGAR